jgi:hypothetical protein
MPIAGQTTTPPSASKMDDGTIKVPGLGKAPAVPEFNAPPFKDIDITGRKKAAEDAAGIISDRAKFMEQQDAERVAAGIKDIYPEQFKAIEEEKGKLAGERSKAGWLALAEAGFAAAAGSSPYALQNFGIGALRGVQTFKEADKELRREEKDLRKDMLSLQREQQNMLEARLSNNRAAFDRAQSRVDSLQANVDAAADKQITNKNVFNMDVAKVGYQGRLTGFQQLMDDRRSDRQIAAHVASSNAQLRMAEKRLVASGLATQARVAQAQATALSKWENSREAETVYGTLEEKYGKNWASNPQAKAILNAARTEYVANNLLSLGGLTNEAVRDSSEL